MTFTPGTISGYRSNMTKKAKNTTTIRITKNFKEELDALWVKKNDSYEIILKRLVCLHGLVKNDPILIKEAYKRAEEHGRIEDTGKN